MRMMRNLSTLEAPQEVTLIIEALQEDAPASMIIRWNRSRGEQLNREYRHMTVRSAFSNAAFNLGSIHMISICDFGLNSEILVCLWLYYKSCISVLSISLLFRPFTGWKSQIWEVLGLVLSGFTLLFSESNFDGMLVHNSYQIIDFTLFS